MSEKKCHYFNGTGEAYWYAMYIADCHFLQQLAISAMSKKTDRDKKLVQMEEGAKTLIKHIEKIRTINERKEKAE